MDMQEKSIYISISSPLTSSINPKNATLPAPKNLTSMILTEAAARHACNKIVKDANPPANVVT
jgi:hypothetical protein